MHGLVVDHGGRLRCCPYRLLAREDWTTQDMAAKLLTAIVENRPKKSSAFANGILAGDSVAPSVVAAYGGLDPAETVSGWGLHLV